MRRSGSDDLVTMMSLVKGGCSKGVVGMALTVSGQGERRVIDVSVFFAM